MDKDTVVVCALMLIAAAAVVSVTMETDTDGLSVEEYPARLMVLGNVNGDDYINETDLALLEQKVERAVDYNVDYMYDVNYDGSVNSSDVDYLKKMLEAMETGDWAECPTVYYVNVDCDITAYDMTASKACVTIIIPPLDMVLALDPDLVVGTDFRPQPSDVEGYAPAYRTALDWDEVVNVGDPYNPNKEAIAQLAVEHGGVNVVCGSQKSFGGDLESKLTGAGVQAIRIPSWEYGFSIHGYLTLAFLLERLDAAYEYIEWYDSLDAYVDSLVQQIPDEDILGVAAVYTHKDPMTLLGPSSAEYANILKLGVEDITAKYLGGQQTGGHGNNVSQETIIELIQNYGMNLLVGHQGAPFQVGSGGNAGTYAGIKANYDKWYAENGVALEANDCDFIIIGYSFSDGIGDIINRLILVWYMYPQLFDNADAEEAIKPYVDQWCDFVNISQDAYGQSGWGFDNMNLLYAGQNDPRNIMNGV